MCQENLYNFFHRFSDYENKLRRYIFFNCFFCTKLLPEPCLSCFFFLISIKIASILKDQLLPSQEIFKTEIRPSVLHRVRFSINQLLVTNSKQKIQGICLNLMFVKTLLQYSHNFYSAMQKFLLMQHSFIDYHGTLLATPRDHHNFITLVQYIDR